ncbi:MAG: hypothetical protein LBL39_07695 [Planctomycetaceae bacterium]|nr:hypothetical protein [Planctomycetaceae bacterium]
MKRLLVGEAYCLTGYGIHYAFYNYTLHTLRFCFRFCKEHEEQKGLLGHDNIILKNPNLSVTSIEAVQKRSVTERLFKGEACRRHRLRLLTTFLSQSFDILLCDSLVFSLLL